MRLVHIVDDGERAQMSKRSGDFVSLDELLDDIGSDAVRWFMLWRSHDTTVDLDLELARRESSENPVYYVQYAHARIASILRKAGEAGERAAAEPGERIGQGTAGAGRAGVDQAPARVSRGGPRIRRAPRAAPDLHVLDGRRCRLSRLLSRLPGARRRGGGGRTLAARPLPLREAHDRRSSGPARDLRSRADVMLASPSAGLPSSRRSPPPRRVGCDRERCGVATWRRSATCWGKLGGCRSVLLTGRRGEQGGGRSQSRHRRHCRRQTHGSFGVRSRQTDARHGGWAGERPRAGGVPAPGGERRSRSSSRPSSPVRHRATRARR